jgi:hypothetical protein
LTKGLKVLPNKVFSLIESFPNALKSALNRSKPWHLLSLVLMYRKSELPSTPPENFQLPFEGKLSQDNRWVIMANLIPWSEFEAEYASLFSEEMGAPAQTFRIALGALIIKEKLGTSDRETVEQIKENPYLQY